MALLPPFRIRQKLEQRIRRAKNYENKQLSIVSFTDLLLPHDDTRVSLADEGKILSEGQKG